MKVTEKNVLTFPYKVDHKFEDGNELRTIELDGIKYSYYIKPNGKTFRIRMEASSEYADEIKCPYCGHIYKDSGDCEIYGNDDEEKELTCSNCEKEFTIICNVAYSWSVYKKEGE